MRATRALLACGIAAGIVYIVAGAAQMLFRPGYDPLHHDLSLLANGDLGWIQVATFIASGALTVLFAIGLRRALRAGRAATWAPILLAVDGLGLIGAGIFRADPMNGFPVGTPEGPPVDGGTISGFLHLVFGALGFVGFIAGCIVLSRRFAANKEPRLAAFSVATGALFLAAFVGIASGSSTPAIVLSFTAAVVLAWVWIAVIATRFRQDARE